MWILVIASSAMSVFVVTKLRTSALVADHGRLPTHIPYSERLRGAMFDNVSSFPDTLSALGESCRALAATTDFPFRALRRAFFEGGSGALILISISSLLESTRFRFFECSVRLETDSFESSILVNVN